METIDKSDGENRERIASRNDCVEENERDASQVLC